TKRLGRGTVGLNGGRVRVWGRRDASGGRASGGVATGRGVRRRRFFWVVQHDAGCVSPAGLRARHALGRERAIERPRWVEGDLTRLLGDVLRSLFGGDATPTTGVYQTP